MTATQATFRTPGGKLVKKSYAQKLAQLERRRQQLFEGIGPSARDAFLERLQSRNRKLHATITRSTQKSLAALTDKGRRMSVSQAHSALEQQLASVERLIATELSSGA